MIKHNIKEELLLIMPEHNKELNYWVIYYADYMVKYLGYEKLNIITTDVSVVEMVSGLVTMPYEMSVISDRKMERKIRYYARHSNTMGTCIYKNVKFFTLQYFNKELEVFYRQGIFDLKYLVCKRMYMEQNQFFDIAKIMK